MKKAHQRLLLLCCCACTVLLCGCVSPPPPPPPPDQSSVALGKELFGLAGQQKPLQAVIRLRESLKQVNRVNQVNLDDCNFGFREAGGQKADWLLLLEAAKSPEFQNGARYGEKLKAKTILNVDIVEYIRNTLINADKARKLAFSAGFVSVFDKPSRARDHLDTIWIWALPSE